MHHTAGNRTVIQAESLQRAFSGYYSQKRFLAFPCFLLSFSANVAFSGPAANSWHRPNDMPRSTADASTLASTWTEHYVQLYVRSGNIELVAVSATTTEYT